MTNRRVYQELVFRNNAYKLNYSVSLQPPDSFCTTVLDLLSPLSSVGAKESANLILIVLQLIPLFVVVGAGCVGAAGYVMRLALKNPDCTWVSETAALLCIKYSLAGVSVVKWGTSENKTIHTPPHSPAFKGEVSVVS